MFDSPERDDMWDSQEQEFLVNRKHTFEVVSVSDNSHLGRWQRDWDGKYRDWEGKYQPAQISLEKDPFGNEVG
jgi:hypothetical protein